MKSLCNTTQYCSIYPGFIQAEIAILHKHIGLESLLYVTIDMASVITYQFANRCMWMAECSHQVTQSKAQQGGKETEDRHLLIFTVMKRGDPSL